ncbi:AAA family ATPase [Aureimonas sp. SK2]|uniref:AAA family ATPase n=1 Tax=Aureimonas sp. SK2 TaxID=3015992 RepID=UPI0024440B7B|nr:AAA family ATPase [Aureimonas sp. SK2]
MQAKRFEIPLTALKTNEIQALQKLNYVSLLDHLGGMLSTELVDGALLSKHHMRIEFLMQGLPFAGADQRQQLHLFADYLSDKHPRGGADLKALLASADRLPITFNELRLELIAVGAKPEDVLQADFMLALHGDVDAANRLAGYAVSCIDDAPIMIPFSQGMQSHAWRVGHRAKSGAVWEWRPGVELDILESGIHEIETQLSFLVGSIFGVGSWLRGFRHDRSQASDRARDRFAQDVTQQLIGDAYKRSIAKPDADYVAEKEIDSLVVSDFEIEAAEAAWRAEAEATEKEIAAKKELVALPASASSRTPHAGDTDINEPTVQVLEKVDLTGVNVSENALLKSFSAIGGKQLPLVIAEYDLPAIRQIFLDAWPHAQECVESLFRDAQPGKPFRLHQPVLLLGSAGSGKTTLATHVGKVLGLPAVVYPCASVADGSFGGTPAQWSSRRASVPAELIRSTMTANPLVILDEIEKTGHNDRNGSLLHALLPMLERHTAESYFETAIERTMDLSFVNFIATANSLEGVPAPLRDRFRIVRMPDPGPQHIGTLVRQIIGQLDQDAGRDPRWTPPLAQDEIEVIRKAWSGGSLRKLRRAVEATLATRAAVKAWH